jgi:NADH-quinone oxidoreductase subunit L
MTVPLWALGILSVVGGFIGLPNFIPKTFGGEGHINWLHEWLYPIAADIPLTLSIPAEWVLMIFSIAVAVLATYVAHRMYGKDQLLESDAAISSRFGSLYEVWSEKYRLDELYDGVVVQPTVRFSDRILAVFDLKIVDGFVNAIAGFVRLVGSLLRYIQTGVTSNYAMFLIIGIILVLAILLF